MFQPVKWVVIQINSKDVFSMKGVRYVVLLLPIFLVSLLRGQDYKNGNELDSLLFGFETSTADTSRNQFALDLAGYYSTSDFVLSFHYADEALRIADKAKDSQLKVNTLNWLGTTFFYQGLLDVSLQYYHEALNLGRASNNEIGVVNSLINLGGVLLQLKQYEEAQEYFHDALDLLTTHYSEDSALVPIHQTITLYNNLGIVHENLHQYNQAIDYYIRGVSLAKNSTDSSLYLARLYNNIGSCQIKKKEFIGAYENISASLNIRKANNDNAGMASSYRMMGILYNLKGEEAKALENFYLGYNLASSEGSLPILLSISEHLYELYDKAQQPDSALKYHLLFKTYSDEMRAEEVLRDFTRLELQAKYEGEQERLKFRQRRQTMGYLYLGIILVLLLTILGLLFVLSQSRLRRAKLQKANIQLDLEKNILEKEGVEYDLELKNKELTTSVIYQIQRNELLTEISDKLLSLYKTVKQADQKLVNDIMKDIVSIRDDSIWEEFEARFQQVHTSFYDKINSIHPNLTPNERRLCAFLRLNMSTKEISSITGQSIRSIEVARTRLRKKLDLTNSDIGLIEYLSGI